MIRQQSYLPNSVLSSAMIQATADNGMVEVSNTNELGQVSSEVNLVFCKADFEIYKRIKTGTGILGVVWELF